MSYPIQKAGSASDVTTKNKIQVEYGNILAQQLAVEAGIQTKVTYVSGGAGSSSTLLSASQGNTLFTIAELKSIVANIVSNTATNAAQAAALSSAANRKLGITVNLSNNIAASVPLGPMPLVYLYATTYSGSGTWSDSSGNGKNATLLGGSATKNAVGNGIVLSGNYWTFPNITAGNSWTVSVWFKRTGAFQGSGAAIVTQIQSGSSAVNFSVYSNGLMAHNGTDWSYGNQVPVYALNTWAHTVFTWNGTNLVTYENSIPLGTSQLGVATADGGQAYYIGKSGYNASYPVGEIGEVRIYGSPLTAGQVQNLYNTTQGGYV